MRFKFEADEMVLRTHYCVVVALELDFTENSSDVIISHFVTAHFYICCGGDLEYPHFKAAISDRC